MLFDLRKPGRRLVIQITYVILALLIGGGLVLYGIGNGNNNGGLIDALKNDGSNGNNSFKDEEKSLERKLSNNPKDVANWKRLAEVRYALAAESDGYDQKTNSFNAKGYAQLQSATLAWEKYLALEGNDPAKVDPTLATTMSEAYANLANYGNAAKVQSIVATKKPTSDNYTQLALLYGLAGKSSLSDLAKLKAIELTPKSDRKEFKSSLEQQLAQNQYILSQQRQQAAKPPATVPFQGSNPFSNPASSSSSFPGASGIPAGAFGQ